jgi:hypothetical protein
MYHGLIKCLGSDAEVIYYQSNLYAINIDWNNRR